MTTFSITQESPNADKIYIYPNGDLSGCTGWTAHGSIPNYTCVDEDKNEPDYGVTYVSMATDVTTTDLYELPNQSVSGTINYVKVYNTVRTTTAPNTGLLYYIALSPDSTCTNVFLSTAQNLTDGWAKKSYVWSENPDTSAAWTWGNIDSLCIGMQAFSPVEVTYKSITLRPNADGATTDWEISGAATNYECVDEEIADEYTTYVRSKTDGDIDYYELPNPGLSGTIDTVSVFIVHGKQPGCAGGGIVPALVLGLDVNGDKTFEGGYGTPFSWKTLSSTYTTNPTGGAWTWANIDDLEIYIEIINPGGSGVEYHYVTQAYVTINYHTTDESTNIQVSQVYAEVGYTPSTTTCYLNMPSEISSNHTRNTKMFNFWNGEREVYDHSRSGKSLVLTGKEWYNPSTCTNPCSRITCVRNMGRNGASVTLDGFSFGLWAGTYKIKQFGWQKISNRPEVYDWILELEDES